MGFIDRLNRLDDRMGAIDHNKVAIPIRSAFRELFLPPPVFWLLVAIGLSVAAGFVFVPLGSVVGVVLVGVVGQKAANRVRRRIRDDV